MLCHYTKSLLNCLNSLSLQTNLNFEVCISDNCSEEEILPIIEKYKQKINIIFSKNKKNIGLGNNILKSEFPTKNNDIIYNLKANKKKI